MRLKVATLSAVASCALVFCQFAFAAPQNDTCSIPLDLQREIAGKYPAAKVVNASDLETDDRKFFEADHGNNCPGFVKVDFYGDGKPTFALVLVLGAEPKKNTELIVAHLDGKKWTITRLDTGGPGQYAPVVWGQPPGEYRDVQRDKTIRATRPVIVFCKYEAWSILYAWTDKGVSKIWIAD